MALDPERNTTFDKAILAEIIKGKISPAVPSDRVREIYEKARKNPDLHYSLEMYHMTRADLITKGLRIGRAWKIFMDKHNLNKEERRLVLAFFPELAPVLLHYEFFIPSLELQGSKEQVEKWLPKAESMEIIGCYAQTELGHGSNVRGIETESIYDEVTKEFILNSPTITSTKWWIGGLGVVSTHVLVVARLKVKGQDYGPHAFLVNIRDIKTHEPFPGIDVGDIGPKMGLHSNDNGFLRFDHFRVPKDAMLNKFARINDYGDYEIIDPNAIKILYLSLIKARSTLVYDAWYPLSNALTISIRYSLVREQFPDPENPKKEKKILDYQIQRYKLFRILARLYSLAFIKPLFKDLYDKAERKLENGDDSDLPFLHCIMSLYKSYITFNVLEGLEEARRSCGGHGYMMLSGLPSLYANYLPSITYDGDNSILTLQAARYFMSVLRKPTVMHEHLEYLTAARVPLTGDPYSLDFHQLCFDTASRNKFQRLVSREAQLLSKGLKKEIIWNNELQVEAIEACEAAYYSSIHRFFAKGLSEINDTNVRRILEAIRQVFATTELERFHGELLRSGISPDTLDSFKRVQLEGLDRIRPDALGLIEAFEVDDECLNSVIGNKDGLVYQNMLRTTKTLNPLNKHKVFPGIKQHLKPKL